MCCGAGIACCTILGLCAGAGTLPPARVSAQPAQGEALGGRSDPQQGRVLLLVRGCCVGQDCSELHLTTRIVPIGDFKEKV